MTRQFSNSLSIIGSALRTTAGSYLDGTVRLAGITCATCSAPVERGYDLCYPCHTLTGAQVAVADRVASLVYAVKPDSQTYAVLRSYKAQFPSRQASETMTLLLALGFHGHVQCCGLLASSPVSGFSVVPSRSGRMTLQELVTQVVGSNLPEVSILPPEQPTGRRFAPEGWRIADTELPDHVLVVDDSWVTGSNAQSVAAALKESGVRRVSVMTVGRVLDAHWGPNPQFIKDRLVGGTYDWTSCPWTGGSCP